MEISKLKLVGPFLLQRNNRVLKCLALSFENSFEKWLQVGKAVCLYIYVRTCVYVHTHMHTHQYIYICMDVHIYSYMYICTWYIYQGTKSTSMLQVSILRSTVTNPKVLQKSKGISYQSHYRHSTCLFNHSALIHVAWQDSIIVRSCVQRTHVYIYIGRRDEILDYLFFSSSYFPSKRKKQKIWM